MCYSRVTWKIAFVSQIPRNFKFVIYQDTETNCQSVVYICQIEPDIHAINIPTKMYQRVQCEMSNRIKMSLKTPNIHVNNVSLVKELSGDGVYWSGAGRGRVKSKFEKAIKDSLGKTRMMSEE